MKLFGFEITRQKAAPAGLQSVSSRSSWWSPYGWIHESFAGAWQQNVTLDNNVTMLTFSAVFSCVTGIASDVSKLRIKLTKIRDGIWEEIEGPSPFLPVLRKPNHFQNYIQFTCSWIVSKLLHGNAYILKARDARGIVTALYVLDPMRVTPLVAPSGDVYYELKADYLSGLQDIVTIPASEIIHDRGVCLWHPLVGVSPLYACAWSATMGNRIQSNSTVLFGNFSRPSGILSAPGEISDETATRLATTWQTKFGGENQGKIAVLGDGLKFEAMTMPAESAQLIEQLKWTVEDVARAFHYPFYKLGGPLPPYGTNVQPLVMGYYNDCLQSLIESVEVCLDEGLSLPSDMGTEMDLDNLWRMDTKALFESNSEGVKGGWMKIDEARFRANLSKVRGGDTPYLQQQNFSLEALAKRDAGDDPFAAGATPKPTPDPNPPLPPKQLAAATTESEFTLLRALALYKLSLRAS